MNVSLENFPAQLLMVRLEENRWSAALDRFLRTWRPAGVVLAEPLPRSAQATVEFLDKIAQALPVVPFLAIRQEGGARDPFRQFLPELPSLQAAAQKGLPAVARMGELIGEALSLFGFNTNFAPTLDLATPVTAGVLGRSAFSADPQQVAQCGGAFLRGLRQHKILACAKHFPGWGSVPAPGTRALPVSGKSMAALWREDVFPFRELLPQLSMVLVSNAAYKAYDLDLPVPASLSRQVLEGLLRTKLDYRGVAMAFDLESKDVQGLLDLGEAAVQSLNAGCDLLLLDQGSETEAGARALKGALEMGRLPSLRVEQALERVHAAMKFLTSPTGRISQRVLEQLSQRMASFSKGFRPEELKTA
jgi:beta-N-acetylhexosaminidase